MFHGGDLLISETFPELTTWTVPHLKAWVSVHGRGQCIPESHSGPLLLESGKTNLRQEFNYQAADVDSLTCSRSYRLLVVKRNQCVPFDMQRSAHANFWTSLPTEVAFSSLLRTYLSTSWRGFA